MIQSLSALACCPPMAVALPHAQRQPLFQAIKSDDLNGVNNLIDHGWGNVEHGDGHIMTPLQLAASLGRLNICRALMERAGVLLETENKKYTALHYAVAHGHESVCRYLVERGADVLRRDLYGKTSLQVAVMQRAPLSLIAFLTQAEHAAKNTTSFKDGKVSFPVVAAIPQVPILGSPASELTIRDLEQKSSAKPVELEQKHLAKPEDLGRRHLAAQTELQQRHIVTNAQLERELVELKGVIAKKSQSEEEYKMQLESLKQQTKSRSEAEGELRNLLRKEMTELQQRHVGEKAQLEREVEKGKGVTAKKSQLVDALKMQLESLTRQIKSQSEAEESLKKNMAKQEQEHFKKQAGWELEMEEWKAVVADKSRSEEACRVELENLKQNVESLVESTRKEAAATFEAKVSELSSRLKECEEERDAAVVSCGTMKELADALKELSVKSEKQVEKQGKVSGAEVECHKQDDTGVKTMNTSQKNEALSDGMKTEASDIVELQHNYNPKNVVQNFEWQRQVTRRLLKMAKEDLEEAQTSKREMAVKIASLEADAKLWESKYGEIVQHGSSLIKAAEEKALKAQRELAEAKQHSSVGLAELKNCTKAKQRIAELEEASQIAADKLKILETCNANYIKIVESSKQELEDVSLKVAKVERKLDRKNEKIDELVKALDAANAKCDVANEKYDIANEKLQATGLELYEERKAREAKIKIIESSKQELKDVSLEVARLERKVGLKNERIHELFESLDAANEKYDIANEKLQSTGLELHEERKVNEAKQHLTSSLELAELNCTKAKQRIAELEEASLLAEGRFRDLQTHTEKQIKQIESSKQELGVVLDQNASLKRKLGQRNLKIEELVEALDAANTKCDVANEKLQAARQKLQEEKKANEAKMNSTVPVPDTSASNNPKRVADSDEIEITGPSRKKTRCASDTEEVCGAVVVSSTNQSSATYSSSYDTWYQNLLYCVNMMIAAKGGSTGKWPLTIERASNEKMALSVLDKMMHETALRSFFKAFEVKMTNPADQKGRGRKKKENTMEHGLDAGGLTNDLLGKVFNGLLEIKVNVLGNAQKKFLFADDENAAWALPLEDHEVTAEAAILYDGVGRLFLKAILSGANTEADTPTLIPDTVFNPCFLHVCLDRGITKSDAGNCMMSSEDVRDALESLLPPDHFGLLSADALIDKSATMNWATGDDADAEILVTHDNHDMYGRKFLERILSTRKVAFEHMKKGFFLTVDHERHGYIPPLKFFNSKQLRVLLCGKIVKPELILSTLNFVDGNHPDETGGEIGNTGDSWAAPSMRDTKQWLIEFIANLDAQECEDFLNYCAAVVRIPYARSLTDGGGQSSFQIHVIARGGSEKRNALPSAQTCFRKLSLPAYTSYNELQKAFRVAFEHAGGYFGKE